MKQKFKDIDFRLDSLARIDQCNAIIASYTAQGLRLTLRQPYYQLVSANVILNNERSYQNLSSLVTNARLAGLMDWEAIEDRVRVPRVPTDFKDLNELVEAYEEHKTVWVCAVCGSLDVQHAMWVNVNTKEVFEDFGSWCNGDNNWCEQCEEHTEIIEETQINAVRVETQQEGEPVEDFLNRAMKEPKEKRT